MSNTSLNRELQELILAHLDDAITPEQSQKLKCLLKKDADTRKYYTECVMLYAALKRYCAASPQADQTILTLAAFSDPSITPFAEKKVIPLNSGVLDNSFWEAMAEDEVTAPGIRIPKEIRQPELIRNISHEKVIWSFKKSTVISILVNIAAMLLLVLFIRFAPIRGKSFAYVIEGYQAEVQDVESGFRPGQYLNDKPLKLNKGLLKIQMNDGSVVLLEGPTEIRLENNDQLFLIQGKLTAHVPPEAIGFTV
ncbi:MAG: hypothetical protein JW925_06895, partial [Syntrophaceae bacterium]|nr:hypothetical protein [Syntrophaceae bacterium]